MDLRAPARRRRDPGAQTARRIHVSFVAGGTGFTPIKAMIEQQITLGSTDHKRLYWGASGLEDLYELDVLRDWKERDPETLITLAIEHGPLPQSVPPGIEAVSGTVTDALVARGETLSGFDACAAGPPAMVTPVVEVLTGAGMDRRRIIVGSFGG